MDDFFDFNLRDVLPTRLHSSLDEKFRQLRPVITLALQAVAIVKRMHCYIFGVVA